METVTLASAIARTVQAVSDVCTGALLASAIAREAQLASAIAPTVTLTSIIELEDDE